MKVFEFIYPGTWLDLPDPERIRAFGDILRLLEGHFVDASVALNMFVDAWGSQPRPPKREDWQRDFTRRGELKTQYERELGVDRSGGVTLSREQEDELSERVDMEVKRERWSAGIPPQSYQIAILTLHARSFVYALDGFERALGVLAREKDTPAAIPGRLDAFNKSFPTLKGVRDTSHHMEDRARGLKKSGKRLKLQPMDNWLAKAPAGGVMAFNCLNGSRFACTMADGTLGEIDVSLQSLDVRKACLQSVLVDFPWKGPRQHRPL